MTTLTRAEDIALEIQRRLALISVAAGCETNVGAFISRGNRSIDVSKAPCCVLVEGTDHVGDQTPTQGNMVVTQDYVIAAVLACNVDHPNDAAHMAIRDVKRALFRSDDKLPDTTFSGKVKKVTYRGRDIQPRGDGKNFVAAIVEISVEYPEKLYAP